jgi:hypothetical protein
MNPVCVIFHSANHARKQFSNETFSHILKQDLKGDELFLHSCNESQGSMQDQISKNMVPTCKSSDEYRIFHNAPVATRITGLQTCVEFSGMVNPWPSCINSVVNKQKPVAIFWTHGNHE